MRSFIVVAACAAAALPSAAFACKCVEGAPLAIFQKTQVLVEGKVVAVTKPEREPSTVRYSVQVAKAWKGAAAGDKVTVVSDKEGKCAVKLAEGQSVIVAATDEGLGFASLKPCHPFFRPATARDAAAMRKNLDSMKQKMGRPDDLPDVAAATAKAKAKGKKQK